MADGLAAVLCALSSRYELALTEPGSNQRYAGAYRILAHLDAKARGLVSSTHLAARSHASVATQASRLADWRHCNSKWLALSAAERLTRLRPLLCTPACGPHLLPHRSAASCFLLL